MREIATVIKAERGRATIKVERKTACGDCANKCMIGRDNLSVETTVKNTVDAKVGDKVIVEMSFQDLLSASKIVYLIPLTAFILGALLGFYVIKDSWGIDKDLMGFLMAVLFTAICYIGIKVADAKGLFKDKFNMQIIDIYQGTEI